MKSITINTVQGIGDIFWVYQKVAPYVNEIHWRIWRVGDDPVQFRSQEFVGLLPKTASIKFPLVPVDKYHELARSNFPLAEVLKHPAVNYAVNNPLENGADLYTMDPGHEVARNIQLQSGLNPPTAEYLCLFVAGSTAEFVWPMTMWATYAHQLLQALSLKDVVVIGASWDKYNAGEITIMLQRLGYNVQNMTNCINLNDTIKVIRAARFFFGYQSGLNVIADNYDVPQLMVYFPFLRNMMYTWAKPENRRTTFQAITFDEADVPAAIERVRHFMIG